MKTTKTNNKIEFSVLDYPLFTLLLLHFILSTTYNNPNQFINLFSPSSASLSPSFPLFSSLLPCRFLNNIFVLFLLPTTSIYLFFLFFSLISLCFTSFIFSFTSITLILVLFLFIYRLFVLLQIKFH